MGQNLMANKAQKSAITSSDNYYTSICPVRDNKSAILTITMDDGYPRSSAYYEQQFINNDLRGTSVLITDWLDNNISNKRYFQQLLTRGRWEIGSHSRTHINLTQTGIVDSVRIREIVRSKQILKSIFPNQNILTFVPPENAYNDSVLLYVKPNYWAMRCGDRGYNSLSVTGDQLYTLKVQGVYKTETVQSMNTWIDNAINNKQWLIEMWHGVSEYDPSAYLAPSISLTTPHLKYIGDQQKSGNLWVATFAEAVQYLRERQAANISDNGSSNNRIISITDTLNNTLFNYPLTLKSAIPVDWQYVQITQAGNIQKIVPVIENGISYVYYNVVPNLGDVLLANSTEIGADITGISLSYSGALSQTEGQVSEINFTANTLPSSGTNDGSIEWFVNGVRQQTIGRSFKYTPSAEGFYGVIAKSTTKTVVVYSNVIPIIVTQRNSDLVGTNDTIYINFGGARKGWLTDGWNQLSSGNESLTDILKNVSGNNTGIYYNITNGGFRFGFLSNRANSKYSATINNIDGFPIPKYVLDSTFYQNCAIRYGTNGFPKTYATFNFSGLDSSSVYDFLVFSYRYPGSESPVPYRFSTVTATGDPDTWGGGIVNSTNNASVIKINGIKPDSVNTISFRVDGMTNKTGNTDSTYIAFMTAMRIIKKSPISIPVTLLNNNRTKYGVDIYKKDNSIFMQSSSELDLIRRVVVYNLLGELIYEKSNINQNSFSLQSMIKGIYVFRITTMTGTEAKKILIN